MVAIHFERGEALQQYLQNAHVSQRSHRPVVSEARCNDFADFFARPVAERFVGISDMTMTWKLTVAFLSNAGGKFDVEETESQLFNIIS
jgi:hypothetical protein